MTHNDVARRTSAMPARTVTPRAAACDAAPLPAAGARLLVRELPGRALVRPLPLRRLSRAEADAA
ncbi:hypothetical protein [Kitasatospora cheerisanensis]|uniref:Uncharacterized protein n=1 Tax=Kitasatospora cheerisanensis KCTC 2395 TaxID=1348663 RepID=A0A066Z2K9_9ACTN|nr:hypothetical protein [Kitasatospora cheerisanensis]KDN84576.1 hypothetical protein KCH_36680 [Kitasatospora cheerisanensis KCTC 2395]